MISTLNGDASSTFEAANAEDDFWSFTGEPLDLGKPQIPTEMEFLPLKTENSQLGLLDLASGLLEEIIGFLSLRNRAALAQVPTFVSPLQ